MAKISLKIFNKRSAGQAPYKNARRAFGYSGGTYMNEDSSMQVSSFYRGLMYVSTQIAKLPWEVKDKNNNVIDDNVSKLISLAPNSEMNAMSFRLFMVQQAIIHGNAYADIIDFQSLGGLNNGDPVPDIGIVSFDNAVVARGGIGGRVGVPAAGGLEF